MRKSTNNKGSALVAVIVAVAIVGVLAVIALWISLINYQMKTTEKDAKDNFYSAETVLDEICVGLQSDVSEAYNIAYTNVMQTYSSLEEEDRKNQFIKEFVYNLRSRLRSEENGGSDLRYNLSKLIAYVDTALLDSSRKPYAQIVSTTASNGGQDGLLNLYDSGLCIKGLRITFSDEKGYKSIIETDIKLNIPDMEFLTSVEMPDTFSYSLIGNTGILLSTGITNIEGNVYAGSPYAVDSSNSKTDSMIFEKGAIVKFSNGKYIISEGLFDMDTVSDVKIAPLTQLWTENIVVDGAKLTLEGNTYVADDLTLAGTNPSVSLGSDQGGKYIGFGDSDTVAGNSSAILLNGNKSSLNMSKLDELLVAGYSFIQTSSIDSDLVDNKDIRMGESISLKGNQIAYLVPGECIGVNNYGESLYGRNPITYKEYLNIYNSGTYDLVSPTVTSSKTGHNLQYYIENGSNLEESISTVFVPSTSGIQEDMLVYFYLSLSKERAEEYYKDYFEQSPSKLDTYAKFFANVISSNDSMARVYTAGSYSLYNEEKLTLLPGSDDNISSEIVQTDHTYRALNSTLTTSYDRYVSGELDKTVFDNIINTTNFSAALSLTGSGKKVVSYQAESSDKYTAVLIDNKNGVPYSINSEGQEGGKLRMVIATGDINVNCSFKGTIITLGKIKVNGSQNIANEDVEIMKHLLTAQIDDEKRLYDIFNNGSSYLVSGIIAGEEAKKPENISYSDIIKYENWIKR